MTNRTTTESLTPAEWLIGIAMLAAVFFGGYALRSWQEPSSKFDEFLSQAISECSDRHFLFDGYSREGWHGHVEISMSNPDTAIKTALCVTAFLAVAGHAQAELQPMQPGIIAVNDTSYGCSVEPGPRGVIFYICESVYTIKGDKRDAGLHIIAKELVADAPPRIGLNYAPEGAFIAPRDYNPYGLISGRQFIFHSPVVLEGGEEISIVNDELDFSDADPASPWLICLRHPIAIFITNLDVTLPTGWHSFPHSSKGCEHAE